MGIAKTPVVTQNQFLWSDLEMRFSPQMVSPYYNFVVQVQ